MKASYSKALLALMLVALLASSACATSDAPRVVLHTAKGDVPVRVEVADEPKERNLGLMYRKELAEDAGMLFIFERTEVLTFWMKNTPLPLDMMFIDEERKIVGIVENAVPFTTSQRSVGTPSRYVLEVNGGFSQRHGVKAGDRVSFQGVAAVP